MGKTAGFVIGMVLCGCVGVAHAETPPPAANSDQAAQAVDNTMERRATRRKTVVQNRVKSPLAAQTMAQGVDRRAGRRAAAKKGVINHRAATKAAAGSGQTMAPTASSTTSPQSQ